VLDAIAPEGFGSLLSRVTVTRQLGGGIVRNWRREGLSIRMTAPASNLRR
jgi:hypothetical protein